MIKRNIQIAICILCAIATARAEVAITPDRLALTIHSGDTASIDVTLTNTSAVESTDWTAAVVRPLPSLADVLAAIDDKSAAVTALIPDRHDFTEGVAGTSILNGGNEMYDGAGGNMLNTDLAEMIPYSDGIIVDGHAGVGPAGSYFTRKVRGLFVFAADLDGVSEFSITGDLGADGDGIGGGTELTAVAGGIRYKGLVARAGAATNPSVNHIIIVRDSPTVSHSFLRNNFFERHELSGLDPSGERLYHLLFASRNGGFVSNDNALAIMETFLAQLAPEPAGLSGDGSGQIAAGASHQLAVTIDAAGVEGTQSAQFIASSGGIETSVPINLTITPAPGMRLPDGAAVDFGTTFAGLGSVVRTATISNAGSQPLAVSDLAIGGADFALADASDFELPPGNSRSLDIIFTPASAGAANATLTFATNDPTDPTGAVELSGEADSAPLQVTPSIPAAALQAGDTDEVTLTLTNTGAEVIDWNIAPPEETSLEQVLAALDENFVAITELVPNRHYFTGGKFGTFIRNEMYPVGNHLKVNSELPTLQYSDGSIRTVQTDVTTTRYFTSKHPALFAFAADVEGVTRFDISGGAGSRSGVIDGREFSVEVGHRTYSGFLKRKVASTTPSVNQLVIVPDVATGRHHFPEDPSDDDHTVEGIDGVERIYYLLFSSLDGGLVDDAAVEQIMRTFIGMLNPTWATLEPKSGSLQPAESVDITLRIDSRGTSPGSHRVLAMLDWAGASSGAAQIPLTLDVADAAGLRIESGTAEEFGEVFTHLGRSHRTIRLSNSGSRELAITGLTIDHPAFALAAPADFQLAPGETRDLAILFNPTQAGPASGTLTFTTNDPTHPNGAVSLSGSAVLPPLSVSPTAPAVTVFAGDPAEFTFTLNNESAIQLDWDIGITGASTLEEILAETDERYTEITSIVPDLFRFVGGIQSSSRMSTNLSGMQFSDGIVRDDARSLGPSGRYFTRKNPGLFIFAADLGAGVTYFHTRSIFSTSRATATGREFKLRQGNKTYTGFFSRNLRFSSPSANHLVIIPDAPATAAHNFYVDFFETDYEHVRGIDGAERIYYLHFASQPGIAVDDATVFEVMRTFVAWLAPTWLAPPSPQGGQLPVGEAPDITLSIDSAGIPAGTHTEALTLNWIDGGQPATGQVPVVLEVTPAAGLRIDGSGTEDFGTVHVNSTGHRRFIQVSNFGTEPLDLTGFGISGSEAFVFIGDPTLLQIPPGESRELEVGFAPVSSGDYTAEFVFATNDPTDPAGTIALTGSALEPPLAITPQAPAVTLNSGDAGQLPITLENVSGAEIDWALKVAGSGSLDLESVLASVDESHSSITALIPLLYEFTEGVDGRKIVSGGLNMFDTGNGLQTDLEVFGAPYSDGVITTNDAFGAAGRYFTRKHPGLFIFAADLDGVERFSITGRAGFMQEGGVTEGLVRERTVGGTHYTGFFKRSFGGGTRPSVNHLVIVEGAPRTAGHDFPSWTYLDTHNVTGISGTERLYYLLFASEDGTRLGDELVGQIMDTFLTSLRPHWVELTSPGGGTFAAGESLSTALSIDATGLAGGQHPAAISLSWLDPTSPRFAEVPLILDVAAASGLQLEDRPGPVQFEPEFTNLNTNSASIPVSNVGSLPLNVTGLRTSSPNFVVADPSDFQIAPGASAQIEVIFAPGVGGDLSGHLLFDTDDPTDPLGSVELAGTAIATPLAISPNRLDVTLNAGESTELGFTLENLADAPLDWAIEEDVSSDLREVLDALDRNFANVTALVPDLHRFVDGITGTRIFDGGRDMYDGGNHLNTDLGASISYRRGAISSSAALGPAGRYFARKHTGLFVFAADLDGVSSFEIDGSLGADGDGTQETSVLDVTYKGRDYTGFFKRTYGTDTPSVNHLIIIEDAPEGVTQSIGETTNSDLHRVEGIESVDRIYYLLFASLNGGKIEDSTAEQIMRAFLGLLGSRWLDIEPQTSGQLAAQGNTTDLTFKFNAEYLAAGVHESLLDVSWDNGVTPGAATLPISFEVIDAPNLFLEGDILDFGTLLRGTPASMEVRVGNNGSSQLRVRSSDIPNPKFTVSPRGNQFSIVSPRQTARFTVRLDSSTAGDFSSTLALFSDDPAGGNPVVNLLARVLDPPTIVDLPASIESSALASTDATETLSFRNTGDTELTWNISPVTFEPVATSLGDTRRTLDRGFASVISKIPDRLDFTGGTFGSSITSEAWGVFTGGNEITASPLASPLPYLNSEISDSRYFTRKYPGLFVFAGDVDLAAGFQIGGALGGTGGQVDGERLEVMVGGVDYHGFVKRVFGANVPSVNHLVILPANESNAHSFPADPNDDSHEISTDLGVTRVYHLLFSSTDGSRIDGAAMSNIMRSFLTLLSPPEVVLPASGGSLAADESTTIDIDILTIDRAPGTYISSLRLSTNDPTNPAINIPVNLEILASELVVAPASIDVTPLDPDTLVTRSIDIASRDEVERQWTARPTVPWISIDITSGTTPSSVEVTIDPAAVPAGAPEIGAIEIESDGETIPLIVTTNVLPFEIDQLISDPARPLVYGIRRGGQFPNDAFLFVIDAFSGVILKEIGIGSNASDATIHAANQKLYVANAGTGTAKVVDLLTFELEQPLAIGVDFSRISSGPAGRLIIDDFPGDQFRVIDTGGGNVVSSRITSLGLGDGDSGGASGYYYRLDSEASMLRRYDVTEDFIAQSITAGPFGLPPDTSSFTLAQHAQRIFWGGFVLDQNLNFIGDLGVEVYATSPTGDLVVTESAVRKLSTGGAELLPLPFPTQISAVSGNGERIVLLDPASQQIVSLPLRDYLVTPQVHNFGQVAVFDSTQRTINIENLGVEDMTIGSVEFEDAAFTIATPLPLAIPANSSANLVIRFAPRRGGPYDTSFTAHATFIDPLPISGSLTASGSEDLSAFPGFDAWRSLYFASPNEPGAGLLENPDGDQWTNLVEFLYFLDPVNGVGPPGHLPEIVALEEDVAVLRYRRASGLDRSLSRYQSSTDLQTWTDVPSGDIEIRSTTDLGNGSEEITVALPHGAARTYYRIATEF